MSDDTPKLGAIDRRGLLAGISIFASLSDADLDRLVEITTVKPLRAKQTLFHKGETAVSLYGVMKGRLKASAAGADGKEVVFALMDPGEVVGEIALLDSEPRSATVVAMEKSELLCLDRRDFLPFVEKHPAVAIELASVLASRLRKLSEVMEDTLFLTLPSRLAKKILMLAQSYGKPTDDGVMIELKLPQQELGELVGTSRESINKQLRAWVEEGLVRVDRGYITVLNRDGLEHLARFLML
jgi:CRP/FNR family cyclic AMP-dependent transcriptional regulator